MANLPLVSVVIPFLDAERFLEEAVRSVQEQSYENWELLLVDDGSRDESGAMARGFASTSPRIRYLHHPDHDNRGISASRNLGVLHASGEFVALLDADDLFRPEKLERQVAILEQHSEAAMVYGKSLYWYSWTGDPQDITRDRVQSHGIPGDTLLHPPRSVALLISGGAAVPSPCSVLARREVIQEIGGFEERFRGMYEDQVFYLKICLNHRVFVSDDCLDCYRQHPASISTASERAGELWAERRRFLSWMSEYLLERGESDPELWQSVRQELWLVRERRGLTLPIQKRLRWVDRRILNLENRLVPAAIRRWLWTRRVPSLDGLPTSGSRNTTTAPSSERG